MKVLYGIHALNQHAFVIYVNSNNYKDNELSSCCRVIDVFGKVSESLRVANYHLKTR